jgi:hypothetical protein
VADGVAAVEVAAVTLVWLVEVEAAHPASAAATIPPATMHPTLAITVVLPRRDRPHYYLDAPALAGLQKSPRNKATMAHQRSGIPRPAYRWPETYRTQKMIEQTIIGKTIRFLLHF